jgi:hypothetical protein
MKHLVAAVLAMLVAAALAAPALADNDGKTTLGPAGYNGPGKTALVTAGTANVILDDGDHVVICHAIGGPKGSRFNQIAPSASGVANGHGGHEADRDIIPPFTLRTKNGTDASLASGQNWNAANAAVYANGCSALTPTPPVTPPTTPTPPVTPPTTPTPPVTPPTGPAPPATPPTIVIEKVEVHTTTVIVKTVKVKAKVKAKKVVKKAKKKVVKKKAKIKVKAAHKVFKPRVLPHTR